MQDGRLLRSAVAASVHFIDRNAVNTPSSCFSTSGEEEQQEFFFPPLLRTPPLNPDLAWPLVHIPLFLNAVGESVHAHDLTRANPRATTIVYGEGRKVFRKSCSAAQV